MGQKSAKGAPQKLETFRLTSRDQSRINEVATIYGGTVQPWAERPGEFEVVTETAELPILLLPGQALSAWYETWSAGGCQRRCDGVTDVISDGPCVCDTETGDRKCKPTTRLSVMLPEIPGLGVWRLESHGYYAAVELSATAGMLEQAAARGQMFPARLRIDQRSQVKEGKTTRYAVPVIDIDVRLPEALGFSDRPALSSGYTPIVALERPGISVGEGLEAVARESAPRIPSGRSPAPLGPAPSDVDFVEHAPIPVEETPAAASFPPNVQPDATAATRYVTEPQRRRLFALAKIAGLDNARLKEIVAEVTGQDSTKAIPVAAYDMLCAAVEAHQADAPEALSSFERLAAQAQQARADLVAAGVERDNV